MFVNERGDWGCSQRMILQKRMSCDCQDLGITDTLREFPYDVELPKNLVNGAYYFLWVDTDDPCSLGDEMHFWPKFIKIKSNA